MSSGLATVFRQARVSDQSTMSASHTTNGYQSVHGIRQKIAISSGSRLRGPSPPDLQA